jgi:hypothetical protein
MSVYASFDANDVGGIDGLGRLVSAAETLMGPSGSAVTHEVSNIYDGLGQLTDASISNINSSTWTADYTYNEDGNVTSKTEGGSTTDFEYDSDNDGNDDCDYMTKIGDDSLVWDDNGRLTTSVTASLVYNWDGKLRSATAGGDSIAVKYDPMGNRVYKESTVSSETTKRKFIVDISSKLPTILLEIDPDISSLEKSYIYSGPQVISAGHHYYGDPADPNDNWIDSYFYLHDRLGSVRQIVDPNTATVVATYTYNPYGMDFATEVISDNYSYLPATIKVSG